MSYLKNFSQTAIESIVDQAIDKLKNISPDDVYACDFHNEAFNQDYFVIGYYYAEEWIKNSGISTFAAIGIITEYEKFQFGEVSTDLSDSEKVVNMLAYILGEEVINGCKAISDSWDSYLSEETINEAIEQLTEEYL